MADDNGESSTLPDVSCTNDIAGRHKEKDIWSQRYCDRVEDSWTTIKAREKCMMVVTLTSCDRGRQRDKWYGEDGDEGAGGRVAKSVRVCGSYQDEHHYR